MQTKSLKEPSRTGNPGPRKGRKSREDWLAGATQAAVTAGTAGCAAILTTGASGSLLAWEITVGSGFGARSPRPLKPAGVSRPLQISSFSGLAYPVTINLAQPGTAIRQRPSPGQRLARRAGKARTAKTVGRPKHLHYDTP